ncbi:MAG: 4-hydroxybenzoate octaprenyltransferase, partial [Burkholderiaceae bacterium]|nr:4-hydroxybenzoate octaprenyltransferase [Burkholderiaceae bacterium]
MACYFAYLLIWGLMLIHRVPGPWFSLGLGLAAAQALWHGAMIRDRSREGCFRAFSLNHWLGFAVFAGIVAGWL